MEKFKPSKSLIEKIIPIIKVQNKNIQKKEFEESVKEMGLMKTLAGYVLFPFVRMRYGNYWGLSRKNFSERIREMFSEEIYAQTLSFWKDSKINEEILIIKEKNFMQDFLTGLKYRFEGYSFPEEFYKSLSKEMFNYYSKDKKENENFGLSCSENSLFLKVKKERTFPEMN
jgi:hypothetical protein